MLLGPADRIELSLIVMPTLPSVPVRMTSAACRRAPTAPGNGLTVALDGDVALRHLDLTDVGSSERRPT